jgi:L-amino acid N-acyltransferase YncA
MRVDLHLPDEKATPATEATLPSNNAHGATGPDLNTTSVFSTEVTNGETVIRQARAEDVHSVVRIYLQGFEASWGCPPTRTMESYLAMFQSRVTAPLGHSRIWVATAHGHVIGWQALQDLGFLAQSSTYVDSNWHAAGIGRKLLAHAQQNARNLSFTHIVGWILKNNASSIGLVQSLGWQFVGSLPRSSPTSPEYVYYVHMVLDVPEGDCG